MYDSRIRGMQNVKIMRVRHPLPARDSENHIDITNCTDLLFYDFTQNGLKSNQTELANPDFPSRCFDVFTVIIYKKDIAGRDTKHLTYLWEKRIKAG